MLSRYIRAFSSKISSVSIIPLRHHDFSKEEKNHQDFMKAIHVNFGSITNGCIIEYKNNINNCYYYKHFTFGKNYILDDNIHSIILLNDTRIFLENDNNMETYDVQRIYPINSNQQITMSVQYYPNGIIGVSNLLSVIYL